MIARADRSDRIERARKEMAAQGIDVLFIPVSVNLQYLTGVSMHKTERLTALILTAETDPVILCPAFEGSRVARMAASCRFLTWEEHEDPYAIAASLIVRYRRAPCVAVEESTWFSEYQQLARSLSGAVFVGAGSVCEPLRLIKSREEVRQIQEAIRAITSARQRLLAELEPGMRQNEARERLRAYATNEGGEEPVTGVNFGVNTSIPHGGSADVALEEGMTIMIDCGLGLAGYRSDITRTVAWKRAPEGFSDVWGVVREAQAAAIDTVRPGVPAEAVDAAARRVIEAAGYGPYFSHRTGHGIGLLEHEPPWITRGNGTRLQPGMVFTVEPGIYLPERFGVRIEDIVAVTDDGCVLLSEPTGFNEGVLP